MRAPLEYGDNFPVAPGSWNPAVPWRFPNTEVRIPRRSPLAMLLPWLTLGLGLALGALWMSWRAPASGAGGDSPKAALRPAIPATVEGAGAVELAPKEKETLPAQKPLRMRSRWA